MKCSHPIIRVAVLVCALAVAASCSDRALRGTSEPSTDGGTYLVVDEDNGGQCGQIMVDGQEWPVPLHEPHPVSAGVHVISCGDSAGTEFTVEEGTTFHFDYWGP